MIGHIGSHVDRSGLNALTSFDVESYQDSKPQLTAVFHPDLNLPPTKLHKLTLGRPYLAIMSDQVQEFLDIPKDFVKDGTQFLTRCTKRTANFFAHLSLRSLLI